MENSKKKRRLNGVHRWTDSQVQALLNAVIDIVEDNIENFEKPVAHKFYERVAMNCPILSDISLITLKSKMRTLKASYISAMEWKLNTGARLMDDGDERSVKKYVSKVCPYFDDLHTIFGQNKSVISAYTYSSTQGEDESNTENTTEVVYIEEDSTASTSFMSETDPVKRRKHRTSESPTETTLFSALVSVQEKKLELETKRLEWEMEKEDKMLELEKMKIEKDERIARLKIESEEKIRMFEIRAKYNQFVLNEI